MKPTDVKSSTYIDVGEEKNEKDPIFEVDYHVRISKDKNIFAKITLQTGLKKFARLKKLKILSHGHIQ